VAERDCRRCKHWKGCPGKWYSVFNDKGEEEKYEWYHYGEIRWCPQQILWILSHAFTFRAGEWVAKHEESGESRQLHPEAYFVKAGIAIAEIEARLETVDGNGELLITQVEDGRTMGNLSDGARAILMYVKGRKRKRIDFHRWRREIWEASKTGEKHQLMQA